MSRLVCLCAFAAAAIAAEYHVTPGGSAGNEGSAKRPWSLARALSASDVVKPGDTICVHGGTYTGGFDVRLTGTESAPVVVRPYRAERVVIDAQGARVAGLNVTGQWTTLRDLEITDSDPDRTRERPHGVFVRGAHTSLINLVVHDCGVGIGFWSECTGPAEIYGCIIYQNGWQGPEGDRGHGHAIYTQNREGTKRLLDNIMFNQFSYGIHAYGSARAFLRGFDIEGNVSFNNGSLSRKRAMTNNILVGGDSPAERIAVIGNFTYFDQAGASLRAGYGPVNHDVTIRDNYLYGGVRVQLWERVRFTGNTVIGGGVRLDLPAGVAASVYEWERNTYLDATPPAFEAAARTARPTGARVFVRPNRYEAGRANVIVYNWDKAEFVDVDLKGVLEPGQRFELRHAQNYFGPPVLLGKYAGTPVRLPMTARPPAAPVGEVPSAPLPTGPEFDVFVVTLARK